MKINNITVPKYLLRSASYAKMSVCSPTQAVKTILRDNKALPSS